MSVEGTRVEGLRGSGAPYPTLSAIGLEIECCLVDRETLDVRPDADRVLALLGGPGACDVVDDDVGWSNELPLHQLELKTFAPTATAAESARRLARSFRRLDERLELLGLAALPSGMHPWMDPRRETVLWPHEGHEVYAAYDRLYDCRRHGWSNVQSTHVNLPFDDAAGFAGLLAAARVVLPLVPALAASSPFVEGRATGRQSNRLAHYVDNARRTPAMTGDVIPEPIFDPERYRRAVIGAIARQVEAIAGASPIAGELWSNARGAIARFDRHAVELRLADAQECARSDAAVAALLWGLVRGLHEERWSRRADQATVPTRFLRQVLDAVAAEGPDTLLPATLTSLFGRPSETARELLDALAPVCQESDPLLTPALEVVLARGTLSERLLEAAGPDPDRDRLRAVYRRLARCLVEDEPFLPESVG